MYTNKDFKRNISGILDRNQNDIKYKIMMYTDK